MTRLLSALLDQSFVRFVLVGLFNTGLGYGLYLSFHYGMNLHPNLANFASYAIAVAVAFFLYRGFVFGAGEGDRTSEVIKFVVCFLAAFLLNQGILYILFEVLAVHAAIAQALAMIVYTVSFYLLNKRVVFSHIPD